MLMSWTVLREFRANCAYIPKINYWRSYVSLAGEDNDYNDSLYEGIEKRLLEWIKETCHGDVYYSGDLSFEFESEKERDAFDNEFGDSVAFKLMFA